MKLLQIEIPEVKTGDMILDLGCGPGWTLKEIARQGGTAYGMDISSEQLENASDAINDSSEKKAFLIKGAVRDLPFKAESFNLVICCETIEHIGDGELLLHAICKILKPKGLLILSLPVKRVEKCISHFCDHFLAFSGHVRQFSSKEIKEMAKSSGFKVESFRGRYCEWSFFYLLAALFRAIPKIDRRGNRYGIVFPENEKMEKWTGYYKRFWAKAVSWKFGIPLLWIGNILFPKSYFFLLRKKI